MLMADSLTIGKITPLPDYSFSISIPPNSPYDLLMAELRALKADFAALQERVNELEERLHEAEMRA